MYSILDCHPHLRVLSTSVQALLTFRFFLEKSHIILVCLPSCYSIFFFAAFNILFLCSVLLLVSSRLSFLAQSIWCSVCFFFLYKHLILVIDIFFCNFVKNNLSTFELGFLFFLYSYYSLWTFFRKLWDLIFSLTKISISFVSSTLEILYSISCVLLVKLDSVLLTWIP